MRLTRDNVLTLPAGRIRSEYWDDKITGLSLRVTAGGGRTYSLILRDRGRRRRVKIGSAKIITLAQARDKARRMLARLALGEATLGPIYRRGGLTVRDLGVRMMAALRLRATTRKVWGHHWQRNINPVLGDRAAARLLRSDVRAWGRTLAERAPGQANQAWTVLRRAYSWAMQEDILETTPFAGLKKPAPERASSRVLSADELRALLVAIAQQPWTLTDAIEFILLTGVRRAAALGLRREELENLDGTAPRWIVPPERAKRKANAPVQVPHIVPLSRQAVAIVKDRMRLVDGQYLFAAGGDLPITGDSGKYKRAIHRRMEGHLGRSIEPWRVHSLRHTIATHMRESLGVPRDIVALILGHTQEGPSATKIYDRAEMLAERLDALQRWADWLDGLINH